MTGLYISPDVRHYEVPGQVPRLDPDIDLTMSPVPLDVDRDLFDAPPRPILSESAVVQNLGLGAGAEAFVRSLVSRAMGSSNEVTFRQEMMSSLMEQRYDATLRRAIMARALDYFRRARPASRGPGSNGVDPRLEALRQRRGARLTMKSLEKGGSGDGAHLKAAIRKLLEDGGEIGIPTKALVELVRKHGSQAVTAALRSLHVNVQNGRVFMSKSYRNASGQEFETLDDIAKHYADRIRVAAREARLVMKAEPEAMPRGARGTSVDDSRADPPGSRKIWNKRIVEKQPDGRWKVVGHVAGLEDPKSVPQLDPSTLTREHLLHLLQQLIHIHQAHNGKPPVGGEEK